MADGNAILVLHGITMSGASMLRTLGPLGKSLEAQGFELIAPNAGHRMDDAEFAPLVKWLTGFYDKAGQHISETFRDGRFWNAGEHFDWLRTLTDATTGKKTYAALELGLDAIAAAIRGRSVSGVIGFSQGSAMALIVAARALEGDARFQSLRWGVFASGFKPVFDEPRGLTYPLRGSFPALFIHGEVDPIFPGGMAHLKTFSEVFEAPESELLLIPGLSHDVPSSAEDVERIARFVATRSTRPLDAARRTT